MLNLATARTVAAAGLSNNGQLFFIGGGRGPPCGCGRRGWSLARGRDSPPPRLRPRRRQPECGCDDAAGAAGRPRTTLPGSGQQSAPPGSRLRCNAEQHQGDELVVLVLYLGIVP